MELQNNIKSYESINIAEAKESICRQKSHLTVIDITESNFYIRVPVHSA